VVLNSLKKEMKPYALYARQEKKESKKEGIRK